MGHQYILEEWKELDANRIASVLSQRGWWMHRNVAAMLWERYSNEVYAASWMNLPETDEDLWVCLKKFIWG